GEPGDHVMDQAIAQSAPHVGPLGKGHYRNRRAVLRWVTVHCVRLAHGRFGARRGLWRSALHPDRSPELPYRPVIQALRFEQPDQRSQMLLAVAESTAGGQRLQKALVSVPVERRELEPPLEMTEDLLPRAALDQPFQHGGMSAAEAT